ARSPRDPSRRARFGGKADHERPLRATLLGWPGRHRPRHPAPDRFRGSPRQGARRGRRRARAGRRIRAALRGADVDSVLTDAPAPQGSGESAPPPRFSLDLRDDWAALLSRRPALATSLVPYGPVIDAWATWQPSTEASAWHERECRERWRQ